MQTTAMRLDALNWDVINTQLDAEGYAVLPGWMERAEIGVLHALLEQPPAHDGDGNGDGDVGDLFGAPSPSAHSSGCRYFDAPLPEPLQTWRMALYPRLAAIANRWNAALEIEHRYPTQWQAFEQRNLQSGQTREQSHGHRLKSGEHLPLVQYVEGGQVFPLQIVALLSEPGVDFEGGEFVMTEQRPRMQSRPMVLPLALGDLAIIATGVRPFKGSLAYYRVNTKHAISRVRNGQRIGLELLFHYASGSFT